MISTSYSSTLTIEIIYEHEPEHKTRCNLLKISLSQKKFFIRSSKSTRKVRTQKLPQSNAERTFRIHQRMNLFVISSLKLFLVKEKTAYVKDKTLVQIISSKILPTLQFKSVQVLIRNKLGQTKHCCKCSFSFVF